MTEQTQEFEGYDEDAAVSFIRDYVPQNVSDQYSDDEILYVIDAIWDFYENQNEQGYLMGHYRLMSMARSRHVTII